MLFAVHNRVGTSFRLGLNKTGRQLNILNVLRVPAVLHTCSLRDMKQDQRNESFLFV